MLEHVGVQTRGTSMRDKAQAPVSSQRDSRINGRGHPQWAIWDRVGARHGTSEQIEACAGGMQAGVCSRICLGSQLRA